MKWKANIKVDRLTTAHKNCYVFTWLPTRVGPNWVWLERVGKEVILWQSRKHIGVTTIYTDSPC